jgi:hypothetical protein
MREPIFPAELDLLPSLGAPVPVTNVSSDPCIRFARRLAFRPILELRHRDWIAPDFPFARPRGGKVALLAQLRNCVISAQSVLQRNP